jgi:hypothetical protein
VSPRCGEDRLDADRSLRALRVHQLRVERRHRHPADNIIGLGLSGRVYDRSRALVVQHGGSRETSVRPVCAQLCAVNEVETDLNLSDVRSARTLRDMRRIRSGRRLESGVANEKSRLERQTIPSDGNKPWIDITNKWRTNPAP